MVFNDAGADGDRRGEAVVLDRALVDFSLSSGLHWLRLAAFQSQPRSVDPKRRT
jgi:hypothetical protein